MRWPSSKPPHNYMLLTKVDNLSKYFLKDITLKLDCMFIASTVFIFEIELPFAPKNSAFFRNNLVKTDILSHNDTFSASAVNVQVCNRDAKSGAPVTFCSSLAHSAGAKKKFDFYFIFFYQNVIFLF